MEKNICDICGTAYPETEDCCPVCGYSRDLKVEGEPEEENFLEDSPITAAKKVDGKYVTVHEEPDGDEDYEYDGEEDEDLDDDDETSHRVRTGVVILLTVVIMLILSICGFLFVRYLLPNMGAEEPVQTEAAPETAPPAQITTEPGIPCRQLILMSGASLDMTREGEFKLINVIVKPEDTTDELTYFSMDETIATVNSEGRVTAVAEGDTVITVVCGEQRVDCRIFVQFVEETEPPREETTEPENNEAETEAEEVSEATEVTEATEAATQAVQKDVVLKLGKNDFSMSVGYEYTIPLECELEYDEIEWSTGNENVATIENGVIKTHGRGTTQMFARYGDQEVTGWIRVK